MMGKPSRTRLSKSCDGSTTSIPKSSCDMNSSKTQKKKQAAHKKTRRSIMKLFEGMRNESCSSLGNDDSVVIVNSSPVSKRRSRSPILACSNKRSKQDDSLIILDGNDSKADSNNSTLKAKNPVMQCSTPLAKKNSKTLPDLLASNVTSVKSRTLQIQNLNEEIQDLTRDINGDSFITIDLTSETCNNSSFSRNNTTVIDLENVTEDNNDCTVVSVDNTSLSMSGDSDVTVLRRPFNKNNIKSEKLKNVVNGISKLNPTEKSNMLEYILKQILNGCEVPENIKRTLQIKETKSCAIETVEDNYIKEVILGQSNSRNSIGSNIYNPETDVKNKCGLRMIVIDGSNVAMEHSKGREFSVKGLQICIDYFLKRGHVVKAFVPRFRCKWGKSTLPRLLDDLERRSLVVYTPSREIQGRMITSYDDRYIVQCAAEFDGVIVSGDNYRDLLQENPRWRFVIENRLLPFTWVGDMLMFPKDPLGRNGPTLEKFLRHSSVPMPKAT